MATWSIAGGIVTLDLVDTDSGQISRSRTFTAADGIEASQLYTRYRVVNPSDVPLRAFIKVGNGPKVYATAVGSQTLTARGESTAGAELVEQFGVEEAGGGAAANPNAIVFGDFADTAEADDASTLTNIGAGPASSWTLDPTGAPDAYRMHFDGANNYTMNYWRTFLFTGFSAGQAVTVSIPISRSGAYDPGANGGAKVVSSTGAVQGQTGAIASGLHTYVLSGTADGSGVVRVRLGAWSTHYGTPDFDLDYYSITVQAPGAVGGAGSAAFAAPTSCIGTGTGDGGERRV